MSLWPNICDTITSFHTIHDVSRISQVCNNLASSIIDKDGKIPSAGNGWCITSISEVYEMKKHDLFMSIWVRLLCTIDGGRPYVTLIGVAAHDVLLSSLLPPGKHLWDSYLRNNSIGFDNSRCICKSVGCRVQYYTHFAAGLMFTAKYNSYPGLADATSQRPLSRFTRRIQIVWNYLSLWKCEIIF